MARDFELGEHHLPFSRSGSLIRPLYVGVSRPSYSPHMWFIVHLNDVFLI